MLIFLRCYFKNDLEFLVFKSENISFLSITSFEVDDHIPLFCLKSVFKHKKWKKTHIIVKSIHSLLSSEFKVKIDDLYQNNNGFKIVNGIINIDINKSHIPNTYRI